jgi:hypothetical protein
MSLKQAFLTGLAITAAFPGSFAFLFWVALKVCAAVKQRAFNQVFSEVSNVSVAERSVSLPR